ncbi:FAD/NAD-P-binding domain-containing protein [Rhodofomes roseus]|uniref:FAD/NAD-P-binding domain-containing protein n=1 Tax=Rhodofomes roseus TaxID=34475 RepID=A0ABQ8KG86_9APHY|nr:FAD/NAD-P-binding domain-containing protein [Rhodofomes roseus]KAH9836252.1 FAD/NAD-P-binding domain-containing protein [Rhodofomes roseus]
MTDLQDKASTWLSKFAHAAFRVDIDAVVDCFIPGGWLRDALVFTWNTRSLEGREKIAAYLANTLPAPHLGTGLATGFTFETLDRRGHGYAYLRPDGDEWRANGHTLSWEEVFGARREAIEKDPCVAVGAGQTGLHIAARFKQMNIASLVVERHAVVGDQWRQRYPTLSLHTTKNHHTLLYQPYPKNWPTYTPRDKVADWLKQYVESQDLVVWTRSYVLPGASYDSEAERWNVVVRKGDEDRELHPVHIVLATGVLGAPRIPEVPGAETFKGTVFHASKYMGGQSFAGKDCIVVGAGNTSADLCQDLSFRGAKSVTMVQRSSTCVVHIDTVAGAMAQGYPDGVPYEICDIKFSAMPIDLQRAMAREREAEMWEREKPLHDQLRKGGLKLNMGTDGSGQHFLIFERSGGYWVDVGCAPLIESGKVKIKQGVEIKRLTENGVIFDDDSELPADLVIWATGYLDSRLRHRETYGADVVDKTSPIWGLDDEGEIRGTYRPTGHPALWYAGGDFASSRFMSKQLALQIKARELGMCPL